MTSKRTDLFTGPIERKALRYRTRAARSMGGCRDSGPTPTIRFMGRDSEQLAHGGCCEGFASKGRSSDTRIHGAGPSPWAVTASVALLQFFCAVETFSKVVTTFPGLVNVRLTGRPRDRRGCAFEVVGFSQMPRNRARRAGAPYHAKSAGLGFVESCDAATRESRDSTKNQRIRSFDPDSVGEQYGS